MKENREIKNLKNFLYEFADEVSSNAEVSNKYLKENDVDVDKFIQKGLKQIASKLVQIKESDYSAFFFKRVTLAAEIIEKLHQERTFGHVKLQKLMFLCERVSDMKLKGRYVKQAAGPYDRKFMHSVDKELIRQKWFNVEVIKRGDYNAYKYSVGSNVDSYKKYYERYYEESHDTINWLISTFGRPSTKKVELVATIYSCLEEMIEKGQTYDDDLLLNRVFDWSKEKKKKFSKEDIIKAKEWMDQKNLIPAKL